MFLLKLVVLIFLRFANKKIRSQVLITSLRETKIDLYSTIMVFGVVLSLKYSYLFPILKYADVVGSSIIGLMILSLAFKTISENVLSLLGEAEVDSKLISDIRQFILGFRVVKDTQFTLIKYGGYYQIHIILEVNDSLSVRRVANLEHKLKKELVRHRSFHVKYPTIYVTNDLEKESGYMGKEASVLIFSMISNLVVSIFKIVGGVLFQFSSLLADGLQTFSDFVTDIVSFLGAKFSMKQPTKSHPFGFGKVEYLTNLFVGVLLLLLSIFIIVNGIFSTWHIPDILVLWLLLICFGIKLVVIFYLYYVGKKINSQLLITSFSESKMDLYSSLGVIVATILLQFSRDIYVLRYIDVIVGVIIGILVLKTSLEILIENSMNLIGKVEVDSKLSKEIEEFILNIPGVKKVKLFLIRYGKYYKLQMIVEMDSRLTLRQVTNLEEKIKKSVVKHRNFHVKYPTIYVTSHLD